ncbi:hypothetical protein AB0H88_15325 [Nonomuraea sp. NPDC050680]|uniref:hypothetical protein n=1 Tax=Nonomuraea sp. NPDC050680 TaxID=3154630 RepID=UPI00340C1679
MTLEVPASLAVPGLRTAMRFMMNLSLLGLLTTIGHLSEYQDFWRISERPINKNLWFFD